MSRESRRLQALSIARITLLGGLVLIVPSQAISQASIPADDQDLDLIMEKLAPYQKLARECPEDCSDVDKEVAKRVFNDLRNAHYHMQHMWAWLRRASDDYWNLFEAHAETGAAAGAQIAKFQEVLAWQEYWVTIAGGLLDIASLSGNIKDLLEEPEATLEDLIKRVDTYYELLSDLSSAAEVVNRVSTSLGSTELPSIDMPGIDGFENLKSTLSDLRGTVEELRKQADQAGRALKIREINWNKDFRGAFYSIVGRYTKAYADDQIERHKGYVKKLLRELPSWEESQGRAWDAGLRTRERELRAWYVSKALYDLVVIDHATGSGTLTSCLLKMRVVTIDSNFLSDWDPTGSSDIPAEFKLNSWVLYRSPYQREVWNRQLDPPDDPDVSTHWSEALDHFNGTLPRLVDSLPGPGDVCQVSDQGSLTGQYTAERTDHTDAKVTHSGARVRIEYGEGIEFAANLLSVQDRQITEEDPYYEEDPITYTMRIWTFESLDPRYSGIKFYRYADSTPFTHGGAETKLELFYSPSGDDWDGERGWDQGPSGIGGRMVYLRNYYRKDR